MMMTTTTRMTATTSWCVLPSCEKSVGSLGAANPATNPPRCSVNQVSPPQTWLDREHATTWFGAENRLRPGSRLTIDDDDGDAKFGIYATSSKTPAAKKHGNHLRPGTKESTRGKDGLFRPTTRITRTNEITSGTTKPKQKSLRQKNKESACGKEPKKAPAATHPTKKAPAAKDRRRKLLAVTKQRNTCGDEQCRGACSTPYSACFECRFTASPPLPQDSM